jgi:hypothetical protein
MGMNEYDDKKKPYENHLTEKKMKILHELSKDKNYVKIPD